MGGQRLYMGEVPIADLGGLRQGDFYRTLAGRVKAVSYRLMSH
jgi:hypothetical protein